MFTTPCYIRKNTPELRNKLEGLGYSICVCTKFDGAVWLSNLVPTNSIHGVGYFGEDEIYNTQEQALSAYVHETEDIDCGVNEELFLALAALRDDSDYMQWFCNHRGENWVQCTERVYRGSREWHTEHGILHKASVEEILKHFNNK